MVRNEQTQIVFNYLVNDEERYHTVMSIISEGAYAIREYVTHKAVAGNVLVADAMHLFLREVQWNRLAEDLQEQAGYPLTRPLFRCGDIVENCGQRYIVTRVCVGVGDPTQWVLLGKTFDGGGDYQIIGYERFVTLIRRTST